MSRLLPRFDRVSRIPVLEWNEDSMVKWNTRAVLNQLYIENVILNSPSFNKWDDCSENKENKNFKPSTNFKLNH